jgi:hypothetical protein
MSYLDLRALGSWGEGMSMARFWKHGLIFLIKERARNDLSILAAFFSALLRYSSVT